MKIYSNEPHIRQIREVYRQRVSSKLEFYLQQEFAIKDNDAREKCSYGKNGEILYITGHRVDRNNRCLVVDISVLERGDGVKCNEYYAVNYECSIKPIVLYGLEKGEAGYMLNDCMGFVHGGKFEYLHNAIGSSYNRIRKQFLKCEFEQSNIISKINNVFFYGFKYYSPIWEDAYFRFVNVPKNNMASDMFTDGLFGSDDEEVIYYIPPARMEGLRFAPATDSIESLQNQTFTFKGIVFFDGVSLHTATDVFVSKKVVDDSIKTLENVMGVKSFEWNTNSKDAVVRKLISLLPENSQMQCYETEIIRYLGKLYPYVAEGIDIGYKYTGIVNSCKGDYYWFELGEPDGISTIHKDFGIKCENGGLYNTISINDIVGLAQWMSVYKKLKCIVEDGVEKVVNDGMDKLKKQGVYEVVDCSSVIRKLVCKYKEEGFWVGV
jgi:hypothetical protein